MKMRNKIIDLSNADIAIFQEHLLGYYKNNLLTLPENSRREHLQYYAQVVLQMLLEIVLKVSLSSIMRYNEDKKRENLNDKIVASFIHVRDIP